MHQVSRLCRFLRSKYSYSYTTPLHFIRSGPLNAVFRIVVQHERVHTICDEDCLECVVLWIRDNECHVSEIRPILHHVQVCMINIIIFITILSSLRVS